MTSPVPTDSTTLLGLLPELVRLEPDRVAVRDRGLVLTVASLWNRAGSLSSALRERGLKPGDVVAVALPRSGDLVMACFAVMRAGGVVLALDLHSPDARNRRFIEAARARWSIVSPLHPPDCVAATTMLDVQTAGSLESPEAPIQGGDPAFLVFTSGSSGEPKGVLLSHEALAARSHGEYAAYDFTREDSYLLRVSPSLIGLSVGLEILAAGVPVVIAADGFGEDVPALTKLIHDERVTVAGLSPRLIESLLALPQLFPALSSLRVVRSSGEALSTDLATRFKAAFPRCRLLDGYGATETGGVIALGEMGGSGEVRAAWLMPGLAVRLVGEDGRSAKEGEIQAASRMLASGYLGGEEDGAHPRFIIEQDADGSPRRWYRTGDFGRLSDDGALRVLGRLDLQLNVSGVRADPVEIENALRLHPSVRDAAVWTHSDALGRSRLTAYLVSDGAPASSLTLRTFLADILPQALIPGRFIALETLPLTASGKVDRGGLPRPEPPVSDAREARSPLESELLSLFREVLGTAGIGIDGDFFEWGGDSLRAFALTSGIADRLGVRLSAAVVLHAPTVVELAKEVERGDPGQVSTVWLREGLDLPPLICLPGLAGEPLWFLPLVDAIGSSQPILGLSFVGLKPPISIAAAAGRAVGAVRAIQPRGPYFLLGHSLGGVLGFEIAREIRRMGEEVAFVGMIDSFVPGTRRAGGETFAVRLGMRLKRLRNRMLGRTRERLGVARGGVFIPGLREAAQAHRISPADLGITLFRSDRRGRGADPAVGWGPVAKGGVEVIDIAAGRARDLSGLIAEAVGRSLTSTLQASSSRSR